MYNQIKELKVVDTMNQFDVQEALFLLSQEQRKNYEQLHQYEYYFYLLRHDFVDKLYVQYSMADLWTYFYFDKLPIVHSENALFYILRHYLLDNTMKNPNFDRVKRGTVGSTIRALIAAASTMNLYLDHLRTILPNLPQADFDFYEKFSMNKRILFDQRFMEYEHYPKRLIQIDTIIMKELRELTNTQCPQFNQKIEEMKKLIAQMALVERDFFDTAAY